MHLNCTKGFCQVKTNPKIREKLRSGWVGHDPTCVVFMFSHVKNKLIGEGWVGGV